MRQYIKPLSQLRFFRINNPNFQFLSKKLKPQQDRLINLSNTRTQLEQQIPQMISKTLSESLIHDKILLRICPITHPMIPLIHNKYPYLVFSKTLNLVLTNFLLNPNIKLHIINTTIQEPEIPINYEKIESFEEFENEFLDKFSLFEDELINYYCFPWTYKIKIKWQTCTKDCEHLSNLNASNARLGKYSINQIDENFYKNLSLHNIYDTISGLFIKKSDLNIERVLSGVFVFELNLINDKILVLNVENIEISDKKHETVDRLLTI